jgi:hypothetical protein
MSMDICDVCGKEFQEGEQVFDCEEGLCPFNTGSLDPYAPLNFDNIKEGSTYLPEYIPDPDDQDKEL